MLKQFPLVAATALAVLLPACSAGEPADGGAGGSASPATSPTGSQPTATPASTGWDSCEHPEGIGVQYPADWHVNDGGVLPECSAFDPEPLQVPDATEFLDAGALLSVEAVDFATISDPGSLTGEIVEREQRTIDGRDAVRVETQSSGDALLQDGTLSTRWLVDLGGGRSLTLVTHQVGDAQRYESNRAVVDQMAERLSISR